MHRVLPNLNYHNRRQNGSKLTPYLIVIASCFLHAYWNFVLKKAHGTQLFIALSKISEVLIFFVPFFFVAKISGFKLSTSWILIVVGALLTLLNYVFLGRAYSRGDLSVVYPISRAGALLFLPLLAFLLTRERITWIGLCAIASIITGCFLVQLRSFSKGELSATLSAFKGSATAYASMAAATVAAYTLWDRHSVQTLKPFVYFYAYTSLIGVFYAASISINHSAATILSEIKRNWLAILQVGIFNTATYLLVLIALKAGNATYVVALRQLSIVIGALLGWKFLGESMSLSKQIGIAALIVGCLLITVAA